MPFSTKRSAWRDLDRELLSQYEVILKKEFAKQTSTTHCSPQEQRGEMGLGSGEG